MSSSIFVERTRLIITLYTYHMINYLFKNLHTYEERPPQHRHLLYLRVENLLENGKRIHRLCGRIRRYAYIVLNVGIFKTMDVAQSDDS